ncbi:MAG: exonuclease SbcCD subunit D [Actinobacteria bacterium]|nr:MAG: exonuclease SbcCD subunit D [Actinomycetota bacterium]
MKIVHIADTHLGYNAYRAIDKETGLNLREQDTNAAFKQAIDKIIKLKPTLVVHSGDFFDGSRPSNRTISFALKQLLRLTSANIPIVIISGNHSTPRIKGWGSIFSIFEFFEGIYPVYQAEYELINIGGIKLHCIPQCQSKDSFAIELNKLQNIDFSKPYNVLVLHAAIAGIKEFSMDSEFNELLIKEKQLSPMFDYIALGHFHRQVKMKDNAYYAGSTERFGFGEAGEKKGFLVVDLKTNKVEPHYLDIRPMVDLKPIDSAKKEPEQIMQELKIAIEETKPKDKIVRLNVINLTKDTYRELDFEAIKQLLNQAAFYMYNFQTAKSQALSLNPETFGSLDQEFKQFLQPTQIKNKNELAKLGIEYIKKAEDACV